MAIDARPLAYSYIRFSSPEQSKGDSLRRQTAGPGEWCARNGVDLDTSLTIRDLGVSAFRGKHRTGTNGLAAFLRAVELGRVPRGSFLIVENLDRLSREEERTALRLWMDLLDNGINIVQLVPETVFRHDKSDMVDIMRAVIELSRGHSESLVKSVRVSEAWDRRRKAARDTGAIVTKRLPAWVDHVGGKLKPNRERVAVVKRMFRLCLDGYGLSLIVKTLTDEGVPTWGRGASWSKAYVRKILTGRAVLGEYQPEKAGKPDGEPIPDYYPAVIDEGTWLRAQAALAGRRDKPGRVGQNVASLFTGLLWDARTGSRMLIANQTRGSGKNRQKARVLTSADSMDGRAPTVSFPYPVFESAILSELRELDPADVLGVEAEGESAALAAELTAIETRLTAIESALTGDDGDVPALVRAATALEKRRAATAQRLAAARQKEAHPRSATWGEVQTLLDVATDEADRLRLRGLLREVIESIWVLVVPRASHRLAIVQVRFHDGADREYGIHSWAAGYCREGGWSCASWATPGGPGKVECGVDLRDRADADRLRATLETFPKSDWPDLFGA